MAKRFVIAICLAVSPSPALAEGLIDWWLTPDQQGRLYFERGDYQKAARSFEQSEWKAVAFYKAGDFANAAALYANIRTAEGQFYLGNALAKQEKLAPAVAAYKQALELKPNFPEAKFNLEWVEGLLKLARKEYDDAGGTGGKLEADRIVFDKRGAKGKGEMSAQQVQAQKGLSDQELREMWMRRVQTTPGDFLQLKFSYQLQAQEPGEARPEGGGQ
ncbi:MAG: tetratricopeptide repeat protein [Methyloligellaceae bacterium]